MPTIHWCVPEVRALIPDVGEVWWKCCWLCIHARSDGELSQTAPNSVQAFSTLFHVCWTSCAQCITCTIPRYQFQIEQSEAYLRIILVHKNSSVVSLLRIDPFYPGLLRYGSFMHAAVDQNWWWRSCISNLNSSFRSRRFLRSHDWLTKDNIFQARNFFITPLCCDPLKYYGADNTLISAEKRCWSIWANTRSPPLIGFWCDLKGFFRRSQAFLSIRFTPSSALFYRWLLHLQAFDG